MNICIPLQEKSEGTIGITHWKSAGMYCLLDETSGAKKWLERKNLENKISQTSLEQVMEEETIGFILCKDMPTLSKRVFRECGIEVYYTTRQKPEEAFEEWLQGDVLTEPVIDEEMDSCSGSCSSCSSCG